jgi:hypothetical protein
LATGSDHPVARALIILFVAKDSRPRRCRWTDAIVPDPHRPSQVDTAGWHGEELAEEAMTPRHQRVAVAV